MSSRSPHSLSAPVLLSADHDVSQFDCGKPALNRWLQRYAHSNQRNGFTRVLVVCAENRVVGFYGLAPTAVEAVVLPRRIRTGQPPAMIPAILIGQLAVDRDFSGRGLGSALLRHAFERAIQGIHLLGGRAILVDAIDEEAEAYWISNGFEPIPGRRSTLFRSAADIESWLALPA
ncbi:MAG TPA: GNAT family N-acetyltransferase [Alphaproteobacteria bacterium]|nr:GNAT family N-acetyltransferase [Alphaproteobacteria bacterium]